MTEKKYERGKVLTPYLSPFGEDKGAYDPTAEVEVDEDTKLQEEREREEEILEGRTRRMTRKRMVRRVKRRLRRRRIK